MGVQNGLFVVHDEERRARHCDVMSATARRRAPRALSSTSDVGGERLLQERRAAPLEHAAAHDRVVGVARHEEHLAARARRRASCSTSSRPLMPGITTSVDEQVDRPRARVGDPHRASPASAAVEHAVAVRARAARRSASRTASSSSTSSIVSSPRSAGRRRPALASRPSTRLVGARQIDLERGALPGSLSTQIDPPLCLTMP